MHLTQCHSGLCWLFHLHCRVILRLGKSSPECLVLLIYWANISPELTGRKKSAFLFNLQTIIIKLNYRKCWLQSWCMLDPKTDKNLNVSTSTHLELWVWRKRGKTLRPLFVWLTEKKLRDTFSDHNQEEQGPKLFFGVSDVRLTSLVFWRSMDGKQKFLLKTSDASPVKSCTAQNSLGQSFTHT